MLRRSLLILAAVGFVGLSVGCQSTKKPMTDPVAVERPATVPGREYEAVAAAALVFDPPVTADDPPLELSRADREPRVAVGYDGPIVETYSIRVDDQQLSYGLGGRGFGVGGRFGGFGSGGGGSFDRFERRAITERVGVRYR
jgi:hypothetical protein